MLTLRPTQLLVTTATTLLLALSNPTFLLPTQAETIFLGKTRKPVPELAARSKTKKQVESIFRMSSIKTDDERSAVAKRLLKTGKETTDDDVARFVLFNMAKDQAAQACDLKLALDALDAMSAEFEFNEEAVRFTVLRDCANCRGLKSNQKETIRNTADQIVNEYIKDNEFSKAATVLRMVRDATRSWRDVKLTNELADRFDRCNTLNRLYVDVPKAHEKLVLAPDDPEANSTIGNFLAFRKGDWSAAMPFLAKGSDAQVAELAAQEVQSVTGGNAMLQLADAWSVAAESSDDEEIKNRMLGRSLSWYKASVGKLSGLSQVKARKRAEAIEELEIEPIDLSLAKQMAPRPDKLAITKSPLATPLPSVGAFDVKMSTPEPSSGTIDAPESSSGVIDVPKASVGVIDARQQGHAPINVTEAIQLPRDIVKGNWTLEDGVLQSSDERYARVNLPIIPSEGYDLRFNIEPSDRGGKEVVVTTSASKGRRFSIALDSYAQGAHSGLELLDRRPCFQNETHHAGEVLRRSAPNPVHLRVRNNGIRLTLNGDTVFDWEGSHARLTTDRDWEAPDSGRVVLGANRSEVKFSNIQLSPRPKIEIIDAQFGGSGKWSNVTEQIREIYARYNATFRNTSKGLKTKDPWVGWKKKTKIHISIDGKKMTWWLSKENKYDLHHELDERAANR